MVNRSYGLDLWRTVSIWMVLLAHVGYWFDPAKEGFYKVFITPLNYGVEPFFVLGGFLAALSFKKAITRPEIPFQFADAKSYLKRRWLRTLPNYFLFLLIYASAFYIVKPEFSFNSNYLIFTQNFYWLAPDFFSISWSLATQEWFYLFLPFLILLASLLLPKSRQYMVINASILLIFISFISRYYFIENNEITNLEGEIRRIALLRLDSVAIGVLLGFLYMRKTQFFHNYKHIIIFVSLCASISLAFLRREDWFYSAWIVQMAFYPVFSLAIALLLPYFYELSTNKNNIWTNLVTNTSKWSYSIYLCHVLFLDTIYTAANSFGIPILNSQYTILFVIFWIFLVYLSSSFIYKKFEMPVMKHKIFQKQKVATS